MAFYASQLLLRFFLKFTQCSAMKKLTKFICRGFILILLFLLIASPSQAEKIDSLLPTDRAKIVSRNGISEISFLLLEPNKYEGDNGGLLISLEVPKFSEVKAELLPFTTSWSTNVSRETLSDISRVKIILPKEIKSPATALSTAFPPSPNNEREWKTFLFNFSEKRSLLGSPTSVSFVVKSLEDLNFARILLGEPSSHNSKILGAFKSLDKFEDGLIVEAGADYLGTASAVQHFRIPANTFAPETEAFDEMVDFEGAPFNPQHDNVDTIMVRTENVSVPGTTPVRLIRFANKTVEPIRIHSNLGDLEYSIIARLSPTKESGGFITILSNGTYRSTTSLYPLLEFQRVQEGKAVGEPMFIDTAITPVPGFPFYLASEGGKWVTSPPEENRLATDMSSNFFYNNGSINTFTHSNGKGPNLPAKCAKESAQIINQ